MLLKIFSLNGIEYQDDVAGLSVKTRAGDITVLNGHRPIVSVLEKCTAHILTKDHNKIPFEIRSGFLEIDDDNRLNLLVD